MRKTCVSSIFPSHLQKSPTTDNYVDGLLGNQASGANHEVEEFKTHRRPRTPLRSRRTREISVLLESRRSLSSVPTSLTPKRGRGRPYKRANSKGKWEIVKILRERRRGKKLEHEVQWKNT